MKYGILLLFIIAPLTLLSQCPEKNTPIVFVHGYLASGDTYAYPVQRFRQNGYCPEQLRVFDWNSVAAEKGKMVYDSLNRFIQQVLLQTGAQKVHLAGHSAGSGIGRSFLVDSVNARLIDKYIHLAGRPWYFELPHFTNNRALNIFSHADMVVKGGDTIKGAENIAFTDKHHYEVATCEETFVAMYRFFNNRLPAVTPEKKLLTGKKTGFPVSGKAVTLGENKPLANARVHVYEVEQREGKRTNKKNDARFIAGNNGAWGPFYCKPGIYYEFELVPADGSRTISYFMLPFEGPDHLVYLRGFPQKGMVAGMLNQLPSKTDQGLVVIFSGKKALIHGRDTMAMNNIPLSSAAYNPASKTIISTFLFDDGDAQTSGKKIASLSMAPFIGGIDIYLPAGNNITHKAMVNGKTITLPGEPSAKKIMIAVF